MKKIILMVLTVALVVALAVPAFAGELVLSGKEAGVSASATAGSIDQADVLQDTAYIKAETVKFVDGSFVFQMKDLVLSMGEAANNEWTVNSDYGKWYAETGGEGLNFTLSNDKKKWLGYKGFLKTTNKFSKNARFMLTVGGNVAGIDLAMNAAKSDKDNVDMNLFGGMNFGDAKVAGFIGDYTKSNGDNYDYYGGDITFDGVMGNAKVVAGVYSDVKTGSTNKGLAYVAGISDVKISAVNELTLEAYYKYGNAYVSLPGRGAEWHSGQGNIPIANTRQIEVKGSTKVDLFNIDNSLVVEFKRYLIADTNEIVVTDTLALSESIPEVKLVAKVGSAVTNEYTAEGKIIPGIAGLELYPKATNKTGDALKFETDAKYVSGGLTAYAGFIYQAGLDILYGYVDSSETYGALKTRIAGIYIKTDITSTAKIYTRGYAELSTDLSDSFKDFGVKGLYSKDDKAAAKLTAVLGGKYVVSSDTDLKLGYLFRNFDDNNMFIELAKTIGSSTFKLAYGDKDGYKKANEINTFNQISHKRFIKNNNVPWNEIIGDNGATQNLIKASVTVKF